MDAIIKKTVILLFALSPVFISLVLLRQETKIGREALEKVYVALEEEGQIAVVDAEKKRLVKSIGLSHEQDGKIVRYEAHNVQVTPDGSKVLVTANVNRGVMGKNIESEEDLSDGLRDRIFIIDPFADAIIDSIELGIDLHLAHVVSDLNGKVAYVNAQETGQVFVVDLETRKTLGKFELGGQSGPHGLRLSPDGTKLFVALLDGNGMGMIDLAKKKINYFSLPGKAVQTAVTPDGMYVFASIYDAKKIAWFNMNTEESGYITLPQGAAGPVQLYPSPDSSFLYVADQGFYFDQPESKQVYRININQKIVDQTLEAGSAPHGIVIDKQGTFAYVTNLTGDDLSIIDLVLRKEVKKIPVGKMPNGVSIWNRTAGGTP